MKLKNGMMFLALSASLTMSAATPKTGANRENLDESVSPRTLIDTGVEEHPCPCLAAVLTFIYLIIIIWGCK